MAKILTVASVDKLRPIKHLREIPDGQAVGLYLLIYPSARKIWALRYRRPKDRRPAKLTLGTVFTDKRAEPEGAPVIGDHLSLAGARRLVAELKHEIALGRDPGAVHIAKKRSVASADDTFGAAVRDFIEGHAKKHTRRWEGTARLLGLKKTDDGFETIDGGLADRWRDLPVAGIDEDAIFRVVDEARSRGIPGLKRRNKDQSESRARALHSGLSVMFGWLKAKRRIKTNPMVALDSPAAPKARDRVLTTTEIKRLWETCDAEGFPFGPLLKLLLLTGSRLNEVAGMRRDELSEDGALWSIPGSRTKNHRVHLVPLPKLARTILAGVKENGDLVFTTNGTSKVSGWSKLKKRIDAAAKITGWRFHDLRRTTATHMAEIGIAPHVVEACLNHISGSKGGIAGVYNRFAYAPQKKIAFERWASHVAGVVSGRKATVVALRGNAS